MTWSAALCSPAFIRQCYITVLYDLFRYIVAYYGAFQATRKTCVFTTFYQIDVLPVTALLTGFQGVTGSTCNWEHIDLVRVHGY